MVHNIKEKILSSRELIPVVVINNAQKALPLSQAITKAGGHFIEITLRTPVALEAIENIKAGNPDIIIGAGTVLSQKDAQKAIDAGADFLVSPGFDADVTNYALSKDCLMIPGTITPSEVQQAIKLGLNILKFFPAENAGGSAMIKAFGTVYPSVTFMPTGGINLDNVQNYIALSNVGCIGGSWVCSLSDIEESKFEDITEKLKAALALF